MTAWDEVVIGTVPQYDIRAYGALSLVSKADDDYGEIVVAGYASPQVIDRDKHVITKEALAEDLPRFMAHPKYRNVQLLHCLVPGTSVLCPAIGRGQGEHHEYRNIEDLQIGDYVYTHRGRIRKVTTRFEHQVRGEVLRITISNGEVITITDEHPVLTKDGWKKSRDLVIGDVLPWIKEVRKTKDPSAYKTGGWPKGVKLTDLFSGDELERQLEARRQNGRNLGSSGLGAAKTAEMRRGKTLSEAHGEEVALRRKETWSTSDLVRRGENHHWYKGAEKWSTDSERYTVARFHARERDDYMCQVCGITEKEYYENGHKHGLHTHHIDGNPKNNDLSNLVVLCKSCHTKVHHGSALLRVNELGAVPVRNGTTVSAIEWVWYEGTVHNVEVEEDNSYAGKGLIYHNSNVQIGEVIPAWVDPNTGRRYETKVDDIGLFVVVKIRSDRHRPPIVDQVIGDIRSGKLASFSISADAPFESRKHECVNGTCFWVISKIVLYEITICATPVNQDAKFTILSKAFDADGEYARSAFCKDGECPVDARVMYRVLKSEDSPPAPGGPKNGGGSSSNAGSGGGNSGGGSGYASNAKPMSGLTTKPFKPMTKPKSPANRLVPDPMVPKFAKSQKMPGVAGLAVKASDTGRALMIQRALTDDDPAAGMWEFPGGHVEPDEDPKHAAYREWCEETGVKLVGGEITGRWLSKNGKYVGYVYTIPSEKDLDIIDDRDSYTNPDDPDGDEIESIAWWDLDHLPDNPGLREELSEEIPQVLDALKSSNVENSDEVDEFDEGLETESAEHYDSVHGDVEAIADIVRDHLREDPRYYSKVLDEEGGEEDSLEPAEPKKLERANLVTTTMPSLNNPNVNKNSEGVLGDAKPETVGDNGTGVIVYSIEPRTRDGVAPTAPEGDGDSEYQYLNKGGDPMQWTHGYLDLRTGEDHKRTPITRDRKKTPQLSHPDFDPGIRKDIINDLENALVRLSPSDQGPYFVLDAIANKNAWLDWDPAKMDYGIVTPRVTEMIAQNFGILAKEARVAGDGALVNSLSIMASRICRAVPLNASEAIISAYQVAKMAGYLGIQCEPPSIIMKENNDESVGRAALAISGVRDRIEEAVLDRGRRASVDPAILTAMDSLYEDANTLMDGLELGGYVRLDEGPEIGILSDTNSENTIESVEKTDALLEKVQKSTVPISTTFEDPTEDKGGPENLPKKWKNTHLEAEESKGEDPLNKVGMAIPMRPKEDDDEPVIDKDALPKHTGAMIAWYPKSGQARQLAMEGGEDADELHVTFIYLGKDLDEKDLEGVRKILNEECLKQPPLNGEIGGVGKFSPGEDGIPVIALVDVPGLSEFHTKISQRIRDEVKLALPGKHGFTPHMTLRYDPPGVDDLASRGIPEVETTPISISSLWLVIAGKREEFTLDEGIGQVSGQAPAEKSYDVLMNMAKSWDGDLAKAGYRPAVVRTGEDGSKTVWETR